MDKMFVMSTAAALALTASAAAQDADADARTGVNKAATAAPTETIMHTAARAGIKSMDGGVVDTTAPEEPRLAVTDDALPQDEAAARARETFAAADTDGDEVLSRDEFVAALRPTADAIEAGAEPIVAEVEVEADAAAVDAATDAAAGAEVAETEATGQPGVETRELTPSDYITAKFEMISGVDGQLSLSEMETAQAADFEAADADGDDVLSGEEAEAFAALTTGRAMY